MYTIVYTIVCTQYFGTMHIYFTFAYDIAYLRTVFEQLTARACLVAVWYVKMVDWYTESRLAWCEK